ncbi:MAG: Glu-tRNA(Gln) amidotransferase subunit GatE [Thermocladium sp.]
MVKHKVGLEIHVQLDTASKLFCSCPTQLRNDEPHFQVRRRLRPSMSELGQIDPAALWEFRKSRTYIYEGYNDSTCLVELDEEPPHDMNEEALETALAVALRFNAKPFDEVIVMRKVVIDGSNTSGFQRTALVARNGLATFMDLKVPIWTIAIEEDAARRIGENGREVTYRLDRLGIPLIEVSTGPMEYPPNTIMDVAFYIGQTIRNTGKAKRGLGSIRQDLNISIEGGAKVEVKGVPELSLIPKVIQYEIDRQINLLKIRDELIKRGLSPNYGPDLIDVTDQFNETKSNMIQSIIKQGGKVMAMKLPGLSGILGFEIQPKRRFGTELADRVRNWTELGGLLHSDELPNYGITREEAQNIRSRLGVDSFILLSGLNERELMEAATVVANRINESFNGVPEETRAANDDGTTKFLRPRPGSARMYPETDLRPIRITRYILDKAAALMPEPIDEQVNRYLKMGMSRELAMQVVKSPYAKDVDRLISIYGNSVSPTLVATLFVNTLRYIGREEGWFLDPVPVIEDAIRLYIDGKITKEAIQEALEEYAKRRGSTSLEKIIEERKLFKLPPDKVKEIVLEVVSRLGTTDEKIVIQEVMRRYRGLIDARDASMALKDIKQSS